MASGGTMTTFTATLRGYTIGCGQPVNMRPAPQGLGIGQYTAPRLERPFTDGSMVTGPDTLPSRFVTFDALCRGNPEDVESHLADLHAAWGPVRSGTIDLTVALTGGEWILRGRPVDVSFDITNLHYGVGLARLVFEATDPRMFSAVEQSIVLGLNSGGGMDFPLEFPLTFGAGSDSDGSVVNAGTFETEWAAVFSGPVTTPRLALGETGEFIELNGTVPDGSTLVVTSDGQVLFNGSPRPSWPTLRSTFWKLPTGTSTIRYRAASGSGLCTFSWRDARL